MSYDDLWEFARRLIAYGQRKGVISHGDQGISELAEQFDMDESSIIEFFD